MSVLSVEIKGYVDILNGKMDEIYPDDPFVNKLAEKFIKNEVEVPSNFRILKPEKLQKVYISTREYIDFCIEAYGMYASYRNSFSYKRVSADLYSCINKIYYFLGIFNMLRCFSWTYHSYDWNARNLLLQDTAKATIFDQTIGFVLGILDDCDKKSKQLCYSKALELFFSESKDLDYHIGQMFSQIDFPSMSGNLLSEFGFKYTYYDEKRNLYLIPAYLIQALDDMDNLYSIYPVKDDVYLFPDTDAKNLANQIKAKDIKSNYVPYYKDGYHILYGFIV